MTKRSATILIISVILFLIIGGGIYYFVFAEPGEAPEDEDVVEDEDPALFPESDEENRSTSSTQEGDGSDTQVRNQQELNAYRQMSDEPVAGYTWITEEVQVSVGTSSEPETQEIPVLRYAERATGHVYDSFVDSFSKRRISNTTMPKVHEALWSPSGEEFIIRSLSETGDTIETFSARLVQNENTGETRTEGTYLAQNIRDIALSPDGEEIVYLLERPDGSTTFRADIDGSTPEEIYSSSLKEFTLDWQESSLVHLTTRPSGLVDGISYELQLSGGISKIIEDRSGLIVLPSPNGERVLFSESSRNRTNLYVLNQEDDGIEELGVNTLAKKCVWSRGDVERVYCAVPQNLPSGIYPDDWYKGRVSFNDFLLEINTETGGVFLLLDPTTYGEGSIDATNLEISPNGNYLSFINKKDLTLWALEL